MQTKRTESLLHRTLILLAAGVLAAGAGACGGGTSDQLGAEAEFTTAGEDDAGAQDPYTDETFPAPEPAPRTTTPQAAPKPVAATSAPAPRLATLPAGTEFTVNLIGELTSGTATAGQQVEAQVAEDVMVDGRRTIPAGTRATGSVNEVKPAKRFGGQAMVSVTFTSLTLPSGATVPVEGMVAAYAKKDTAKDAGTIAGGAVGGALLGKIIGKDDKDAAVGAVVGGGIATAIASRKGDEALLPDGVDTTVRITQSAQVPAL